MKDFRLFGIFSPANRAEISNRPLKQILWKPNCRLHGEGFSPGRNSARAENPSPVSTNRARIFSPAKRAWKSEKVSCNRNGISARAEKRTRACALTVFSHLSKLSHGICVLRPGICYKKPGWNFSPGWNSPCNILGPKGLITWWISARAEISLRPPGWNIVAITWSISARAQNANFREKVYWGAKTQ